jgi:hypothetical protein
VPVGPAHRLNPLTNHPAKELYEYWLCCAGLVDHFTYTANSYDFVLADATTAAFTITLPTVANGALARVKKVDASGNTVNVVAASGVLIDGAHGSISINSQWQSQDFMSDGTNWYLV